jgi:hypothetical protein
LDNERANLANLFQQLQNERYQQNTPYDVQQQAGLAARQPGLTQQLNLQNQAAQQGIDFTGATQPGKIQATNQENKSKFSSDYLKEQLSKTDNYISAYQQGGAPAFIQAAQALGTPEEKIMEMIQSGDVLGSLKKHRDVTTQMLAETPEMIQNERKLSQTHTQAMELAKMNNAAALERARLVADAAMQRQTAKGTSSKPMSSDQAYAAWLDQQVEEGNIDPAMKGEMLARFKAASAQQQPALVGGQIGTQGQAGNILPPVGTKPTQAHGLADVQKMYPGVPAEKLKEAYKKKFGVDLQ